MSPNGQDFSCNLPPALTLVSEIQESISRVPLDYFLFQAPVIDQSNTGSWRSDDVAGLRKFVESVDAQAAILQDLAKSKKPVKEDPLPHAQSLRTVWAQLLLASPPITGVRTSLKASHGKGKGRAQEGFIDVIHKGGAEWIKVYSKKQSQLLGEFREQDSYVNSDYDTSEDESGSNQLPDERASSSERPVVVNSLMSTVEQLLSLASKVDRIPGASDPNLCLLVTRMPEDPTRHEDERIQVTLDEIRRRGVTVRFGDFSDADLVSVTDNVLGRLSARLRCLEDLRPTLRINLDPTALMGLCSDVIHHPLPKNESEAKARFYRPQQALRPPVQATNGDTPDSGRHQRDPDAQGQSQNSRELVRNLLEEMDHPLIPEIRDTLAVPIEGAGDTDLEFWATREAVTHCREALGSEKTVGEGMEQRRMRRLLRLEEGDFFEGSRYEGQEGVLKHIRVRIFDSHRTPPATKPSGVQGTFFRSLAALSRSLLDDYSTYLDTGESAQLPNFLKPSRMPSPKVASLSLPFPIVSLTSLARGAEEGMTTLMMGNVVLRDLFAQPRWRIKGWAPGELQVDDGEQPAAVWMMPYRTLGEGKRVKFARGDYSYPNK